MLNISHQALSDRIVFSLPDIDRKPEKHQSGIIAIGVTRKFAYLRKIACFGRLIDGVGHVHRSRAASGSQSRWGFAQIPANAGTNTFVFSNAQIEVAPQIDIGEGTCKHSAVRVKK